MTEVWKDIDWAPDLYEVSNTGYVRAKARSLRRSNGNPYTVRGRILAPQLFHGRPRVLLNVTGRYQWHDLSNLVMEAFVGPAPEGAAIAYRDGNQTNCTLANLHYLTAYAKTAKPKSPLTAEQVTAIRARRAAGETLESLAEEFGISRSYVTRLCVGKAATRVSDGPILNPLPRGAKRRLTDNQIAEIVARRAAGEKIVDLGREYGVAHGHISKIFQKYSSRV